MTDADDSEKRTDGDSTDATRGIPGRDADVPAEVEAVARDLAGDLGRDGSDDAAGDGATDDTAEAGDAADEDGRVPDIPRGAVEEAERLTRLARTAPDPEEAAAYRERRDDLAAEHDYAARIRDEDDTLVLYPDEWVEDGVVQFDRIEDTDRGVEVSLSGPGDADRYREVERHNAAVVERVAAEHGPVHEANARAFADFMENHYVREMDSASPDEREEFLTEYFPRNAWPTDDQRAVVEETLELVDECAAAIED